MSDEAEKVISEPQKRRGRPPKKGSSMSALERQKKRQGLTNGVFDCVVSKMSKIHFVNNGNLLEVINNDIFFQDDQKFMISYKNILEFIPPELREDFIERVQSDTVKNYYDYDINVIKRDKESILKEEDIDKKFNRLFITRLIHEYYKKFFKYDRPLFHTLEVVSDFLENPERYNEKKYADLFCKYRRLRKESTDGTYPKWSVPLVNPDRSEKSARTRIDNIRNEFLKVYKNELFIENGIHRYNPLFSIKRELLAEQAFSYVWSLNPEKLKTEYNAFLDKQKQNNVNHDNVVAQNSVDVVPKSSNVVPNEPVIQIPENVVSSSSDVVSEDSEVEKETENKEIS